MLRRGVGCVGGGSGDWRIGGFSDGGFLFEEGRCGHFVFEGFGDGDAGKRRGAYLVHLAR